LKITEAMARKNLTITAITMGDPSGIGPEIILKSFENKVISKSRIIVVGDFRIMQAAYDMLGIKSFSLKKIVASGECMFTPQVLHILDPDPLRKDDFQPGKVNAASGETAYQCIKTAVQLVRNGEANAIATAPINKEALHLAGHRYPGHTEILASLTGTRDFAMLLYHKKLSVIHVSTHISLLEAVSRLRQERIEMVIELADSFMRKLTGKTPKIAVAGINPHAGENGLFGNEELRVILPAVNKMRDKGISVYGPLPPDTVFLQAVNGKYDIAVAMYHDQGHIPVKLLGFHTGVNITLGLPFIRTSVDHGTAFEISWQGKANEESMSEAIRLATKLS
jgi:4-hydroxythreonine-4-phosphate dehydrogenase